MWFIIFFSLIKKRDFFFLVYPLTCLSGAVALPALQKCYHFMFQWHRLEHYTVHSNHLVLETLFLFVLLSVSLCVSLFRGYHGPFDLYPEFYQTAIDPTIHNVSEGQPINVSVGEEWHQFSSFSSFHQSSGASYQNLLRRDHWPPRLFLLTRMTRT